AAAFKFAQESAGARDSIVMRVCPVLNRLGAVFARPGFDAVEGVRGERALAGEQIIHDAPYREAIPMFGRDDAGGEATQTVEAINGNTATSSATSSGAPAFCNAAIRASVSWAS